MIINNSAKVKFEMLAFEFRKNYKEVFYYILASLLVVSIGKDLVKIIQNSPINYITSKFATKIENDILFIGLLLSYIYYIFYIKIYKKELRPSINSIIRFILIIILYCFIIRNNSYLANKHSWINDKIYYLDFTWLAIALANLKLKPYNILKTEKTDLSLIEDYYDSEILEDELSRKPFAENIAKHIIGTTNRKAFSIAIIGNWGSGKTTFMEFIQNFLDEFNPQINITIKYNPWRVTKTKVMIEDFFQSFIAEIKGFDDNLSSKLKSYSNYLQDLDNSIISKFISLTAKLALKDADNADTIIKAYEEINELIGKTGKRYVIFIDDVDRLTGKEMLQVIKIIRNTADFNNVFFVVGIDYNYVIKAIIKTKQIPNATQYLQKIFQQEIILPPFETRKILPRLKISLGYNELPLNEQQRFDLVFDQISEHSSNFKVSIFEDQNTGIIEQNFTSFRDVVRFSNSFRISYRIVNDNVDLIDLFLVEILKMKYPTIYMKIANKELLKFSNEFPENNGPVGYKINYEKLKIIIEKEYTYLTDEISNIKILLSSLYDSKFKDLKTFRTITTPKNHIIYFNFLIFENSISISEWQKVIGLSLEEMIDHTKKWKEKGKEPVLNEILSEYTYFKDVSEFSKFIRLKLSLSDHYWHHDLHNQLMEKEILIEKYNLTKPEEINKFIESILADDKITYLSRILFAEEFLKDILYNRPNQYFDKSQILNLIFELFKSYAENTEKLSNNLFRAYYSNMQEIEKPSTNIILSSEANKFMLEFINKHKTDYLKILLRSAYGPSLGEYVFEPFLKQTFGNPGQNDGYMNFKLFLDSYNEDDKLKNFIKNKFDQYEKAGYSPIKLNEQEIAYLNSLQKGLI